MRLAINTPTVISETIQGETIIINLSTGTYYSLLGTGADVWAAVQRNAPQDAIVHEFEQRYEAPPGKIEAAVGELLGELLAEGLARPAADEETPVAAGEPEASERQPFATPSLAKYTDMQDIILLDPVHEVDERGWPYARA